MVSWDEATGIIEYNVEWAGLLNDEETIGSENITGQHHFMLENLTSSDDNITNNYTVKVSAIREGVKGNSTDVIFSTHSHGMFVNAATWLLCMAIDIYTLPRAQQTIAINT